MKKFILILSALSTLYACKTMMPGYKEVNTPFHGNKYESNGNWARAVASGESTNLETSKDKALLNAKQRMASDVQTEIKNVTEKYKGEREADGTVGDFNERFQQLTREVMSQLLVDIQMIDIKQYQKENKHYETWVALEVKKKDIWNRLKEKAKMRSDLSEKDKEKIEKLIEDAIGKMEEK